MPGVRTETAVLRARGRRATVMLADADVAVHAWLRDALAGHSHLEIATSGAAALASDATLIVVGTTLSDMTGAELIERLGDHHRRVAGEPFKVVEIGRELQTGMPPARVRELLAQEAPSEVAPDPVVLAAVTAKVQPVAAIATLAPAARAAITAFTELVAADRGRCLYVDADSGTVWDGTDDDSEAVPADGTIALVIERDIGIAENGTLMQAVSDGTTVHAILIAERAKPFTARDLDTIGAFAAAWAPHVSQLAATTEAAGTGIATELFRQDAIMHLMRRGHRGDVVRVHPGWVRSAYWIVLAALVGAGVFVSLAHVSSYAQGPAVVRFTGRTEIVAYEPGTISSLAVARGQRVTAGQVLARLHDTEQAGHLHALETEFERKLVAYLQSPADPAVRQELSQIVSQRESARASVESRVIRAPHAGVIKEVLVRDGQRVDSGKVVLSIVENGSDEGLSILAFLPGTERPRLHAHQALRLTMPGFRGAELTAEIRAVSAEVLGATEARARYLGDRLSDSLPFDGTVVVVEARLASPSFTSDGQTYQLHDGMIGNAEVKLASRSVLATIIPGLAR